MKNSGISYYTPYSGVLFTKLTLANIDFKGQILLKLLPNILLKNFASCSNGLNINFLAIFGTLYQSFSDNPAVATNTTWSIFSGYFLKYKFVTTPPKEIPPTVSFSFYQFSFSIIYLTYINRFYGLS